VPKAWTTAADLRAQVQRLWDRGDLLRASFGGAALYPLALRLARPDAQALAHRFDEVRRWIRALDEECKATRGVGYELAWSEINHRQLGRQRIPDAAAIPSEEDALELIGKAKLAGRFRAAAGQTMAICPALGPWIARKPLALLENADDWPGLLAVVAYFQGTPRPGRYLRELDIPGVDSKFIEMRAPLLAELLSTVLAPAPEEPGVAPRSFEQRFGLRSKPALIRFRLLDEAQSIQGMTDVATPAAQFAQLHLPVERVFVTENDINGLTFPEVPRSLVIFGLGYGLERLAEIGWLKRTAIHYWGDIDTHGFAMLDRLRASFPDVQSLLMDRETLMAHRPLWVKEPTPHDGRLQRLTEAEGVLYEDLCLHRLGPQVRLEQERIAYAWVRKRLSSLTA
jgi:hypothetical protein